MTYAPSEDSDQPGHLPSLIRVFTVRMKKHWVLSYPLSTLWRLWSDWVDTKADLSLRWANKSFCFVMRPLINDSSNPHVQPVNEARYGTLSDAFIYFIYISLRLCGCAGISVGNGVGLVVNVLFNNFSVMSWSCLVATWSSVLLLKCCQAEVSCSTITLSGSTRPLLFSYELTTFSHRVVHLNHLIRLWQFLSSVNSFFKCTCAAIQWG